MNPPPLTRLRNYFLTGLVIAAPISITAYLTWTFITYVDETVKPLIPAAYNPDNYLPFSVPGVGLVFAIIALTLLGFITANFIGRSIISAGERMLHSMPLIRNLYSGLKQIFETVLSQNEKSFQRAGLIEYPRRGLYAVVFISTEAQGEVIHKLDDRGEKVFSVFLPTTPNPTSGFLLFVHEEDIIPLDMSVEEAAKLVISAGLVSPEYNQEHLKELAEAAEKQAAE
ncbi:MAG: DUF502 domain-containing protein [Pseudomonadota bacterium]